MKLLDDSKGQKWPILIYVHLLTVRLHTVTTTINVIVQNSNGSSRNIAVAFKKCCKFFVTNRDFQKHEEDGIAM